MKTILIIVVSLFAVIALLLNINNIMSLWIGHYTKGDSVYYRTWHSWKWFAFNSRTVADADTKSMKKMSWCFGKDKDHVFYEEKIIPGCDPKTFKVLSKKNSYGRDEGFVYLGTERISDDPDHFEMYKRGWAKDRKHVFNNGKVFPLDATTLRFLDDDCNFVADKNKVLFQKKEIIGADLETFEILEKGYSKDKNRKYKYSQPIPGGKAALAQ